MTMIRQRPARRRILVYRSDSRVAERCWCRLPRFPRALRENRANRKPIIFGVVVANRPAAIPGSWTGSIRRPTLERKVFSLNTLFVHFYNQGRSQHLRRFSNGSVGSSSSKPLLIAARKKGRLYGTWWSKCDGQGHFQLESCRGWKWTTLMSTLIDGRVRIDYCLTPGACLV